MCNLIETLTILPLTYTFTAIHVWDLCLCHQFRMSKKTKFSCSEQTADEARVAQHFLLVLFLATEVSECVDDDAKDEVEYNDDNDEEEN